MNVKKTDNSLEITLDGAVGEGSPLFLQDVRGLTQISMDLEKMTYINSVGVKAWIQWTMRIPATCKFTLKNLPIMMINQASTVLGFLPKHAVIESFFAPFVCPKCNAESNALLSKGKEYDYPQAGGAKLINLPTLPCPKCRADMEADFTTAKTFAFLDSATS